MNSNVKSELESCIRELYSIARELDSISNDVKTSISGINTVRYIQGLENSANKYRKAAQKLEKIK